MKGRIMERLEQLMPITAGLRDKCERLEAENRRLRKKLILAKRALDQKQDLIWDLENRLNQRLDKP